jgi:methylated-DNA-[protein]-cysteine S-methyltransferase
MTQSPYYAIVNTSAGWVGLSGSAKGLRKLTLPQRSPDEARLLLGHQIKRASESPHFFRELTERLRAYFDGQRVEFPDEVDFSGTEFQRAVWTAARFIPYGETRSYKWLAVQTERPGAARAVGQALGKNPLPVIVPCHRVLASNGTLGGFAGGLEMKRRLLQLEAKATA